MDGGRVDSFEGRRSYLANLTTLGSPGRQQRRQQRAIDCLARATVEDVPDASCNSFGAAD